MWEVDGDIYGREKDKKEQLCGVIIIRRRR